MGQHYSIEIHLRYISVILWNDFESMEEVNVSYKSIELDLNRRQTILLERNLDYSQVIELSEAAELRIVDLDCRYYLTVKEPQGVDLGRYLIKLLSNQGKTHFREGNSLKGL